MNNKLESAGSWLLTVAALIMAAGVVRANVAPKVQRGGHGAKFIDDWKQALPIGRAVGDSSAPVTIVAFIDYECPACAGFHSVLQNVLKAHQGDIRIVYVPFPLPYHRFAMPAARAAECAHIVGRFAEWTDVIYEKRDSLGLRSWGAFARDAQIADTAAIAACAVDPKKVRNIDDGIALGKKFAIDGTPSILINGWLQRDIPGEEELSAEIAKYTGGPVPAKKMTRR